MFLKLFKFILLKFALFFFPITIENDKKTWSLQPPLYTLFGETISPSIEDQMKVKMWDNHFSEYGR